MTEVVLPDAGTDPAGFLLAAADLREAAIYGAPDTTWRVSTQVYDRGEEDHVITADDPRMGEFDSDEMARSDIRAAAEYIVAECNPEHARAEVKLWRGIGKRHQQNVLHGPDGTVSGRCRWCNDTWPCPDLLSAVDAAKAYLGQT